MKQQYVIVLVLCALLLISSCASNTGQATKQQISADDPLEAEKDIDGQIAPQEKNTLDPRLQRATEFPDIAEKQEIEVDLQISEEVPDQIDQLVRDKSADAYPVTVKKSEGFFGSLLDLIKRQDDLGSQDLSEDEIEFEAPAEGECAETDGGLNVYEAGITGGTYGAIGYREVEDYCLVGTRSGEIAEFFCATGGHVQQHVELCASGICENGACRILDEDSTSAPDTDSMPGDDEDRVVPPGYCSDSDGGQDLFTQGTARGDFGAIGYREMTDYCRDGTYSGSLVEYSCNSGRIEQRAFDCPGDCVNGACLSS